ncbi:UDP-N-acetylglucosamine 2-epimerase (non-hydrolyzing) [Halorussus salilacus]|uniref:non-hydrolyzing UDP-N-acetylglucosamine 2-epimerase n=1 Tax=Halorussus salilacus TaxID=2953750 RepID=UPI00209CB24F|nr:UDP-N-acetylglucosamine 2-epimerase (non-hydrolyzing) [Halorussus salilacus]USZ67394.1 UDP-N-acetylglucosamine 2-epimerase (non-hydrolyzing) [Halorussus salilacus]
MDDSQPEVTFVLGTRPEIIKLSPLIRECERRNLSFSIIHTGQHYSDSLDEVFFSRLDLPDPDHNLQVGSKSQGQQTGEMIIGIERILTEERPDVVLVQGDTNSVLAGGIATSKLDIALGHVEAGLRSFDRQMPEEINRVVTDHVADYLFAPTENSREYLQTENVPNNQIYVTGNTIVDAVAEHTELADEKSTVLSDLELTAGEFVLLTAHRAENVDDEARFADLLEGVTRFAKQHNLPVVYPIHPRAENRLEAFGLSVPNWIRCVEPQGFLDFLKLEQSARLILTDSGGVQEEACILGTPCVTLRENTERPETIDVEANRLAGTDPDSIVSHASAMYRRNDIWKNPFGDGDAAVQILETLDSELDLETPREVNQL